MWSVACPWESMGTSSATERKGSSVDAELISILTVRGFLAAGGDCEASSCCSGEGARSGRGLPKSMMQGISLPIARPAASSEPGWHFTRSPDPSPDLKCFHPFRCSPLQKTWVCFVLPHSHQYKDRVQIRLPLPRSCRL